MICNAQKEYKTSPTKYHVVEIVVAMSSQKSTYRSVGARNGSGLTVLFRLLISFVYHNYVLAHFVVNRTQIGVPYVVQSLLSLLY